jgi:hypothetical protein
MRSIKSGQLYVRLHHAADRTFRSIDSIDGIFRIFSASRKYSMNGRNGIVPRGEMLH